MRLDTEIKLDYSSVLIRPKRSTLSSRKQVDLIRDLGFRNTPTAENYNGVPVMAANMDGVGTFEIADALAQHKMFTCLSKTYSVDQLLNFFDIADGNRKNYTAVSIGISDSDSRKFEQVYRRLEYKLKYVCIDVANGYSQAFVEFVKDFKRFFPDIVIIAGNVVTGEMTEELILAGADIVKVGIGPGSVCTTRIKTGVGYPQLSAVIECADAAHGLGGHIIADGGCTSPGDVAKAFAAGADFVMLGGMLAGHDEGGGEVISKHYITNEVVLDQDGNWQEQKVESKKFVQFYGMSSQAANDKHFGGLKDYRSSEGREVFVPYRGAVENTAKDLLGGIRSACTYVGAEKLKYLPRCATFVRCMDTHNRTYE